MAFYDWWRKHILLWITAGNQQRDNRKQPQPQHYHCNRNRNRNYQRYNNLGWKHLKAMVSETREHLSPPPHSYIVSGAGSRAVNGRYRLSPEFLVQTTTMTMTPGGVADADAGGGGGGGSGADPTTGQEQHPQHHRRHGHPYRHRYRYQYRYYGRRSPQTTGTTLSSNTGTVAYEMVSPSPSPTTTTNTTTTTTTTPATTATAISLCRCDMSNGHTSSARNRRAVWFLTELDEEQPNTDCDKDYYYAPTVQLGAGTTKHTNTNNNTTRQQQLPPTSGWTKCPGRHGVFPAPTVVAEVGGGWGGYNSDDRCGGDGNADAHAEEAAISYRDKLAEWIVERDVVAIGIDIGIDTRENRCSNNDDNDNRTTRDEGISSCLDFLMELYEEEESDRHHGRNEHKQQPNERQCQQLPQKSLGPLSSSSSLGTEFLVNFAAWCLSFRQQRQRQP